MATTALRYKVTYSETIADAKSRDFGYTVERTKRVRSFREATTFVRALLSQGSRLVGRPLIEEV